jgi:RNA polymerase sigma-70 factor (ECF subfamily)
LYRDLLATARAGDSKALESLLVPHLAGLTSFVRLHGGTAARGRETAADIVQSVCREAVAGIEKLRGEDEAAFRCWLYAIALNKVRDRYDYHRAKVRDIRREEPMILDSHVDDHEVLSCYASFESPSKEAIVKEELARMEAAFDQLPEDHREVLSLTRIAGLSYAEVGERLGKTEGAVRQLVYRARARLAGLLASG